MKTIEEKAKAYDEKVSQAKEMLKDGAISQNTIDYIQRLFPELVESEDKKWRSWLIGHLEGYKNTTTPQYSKACDEAIAWLEKQSEQNLPSVNERAWLYLVCDVLTWERGLGQYLDDPRVQKLAKDLCSEYAQKLYNFPTSSNSSNIGNNKQESADKDKVEPKFHEGEWVINQIGYIRQILDIKNNCYYCDGNGKGYWTLPIEYADKYWRKWTINDAKDGDVLCCESGWTCIFKALNSDISFSSYCFMDNTGWFCETGSESHTLEKAFIKTYNGNIHPATKEQRDTLEKAMADAGYTFDFEKKELKELAHQEVTKASSQETYGWSEEDETKLTTAETFIKNTSLIGNDGIKEVTIDWFKSLKDRVQSQNKRKVSLATADLENSLCDIQDAFSDTSYEYRILGEAIEFIRCTEIKPQWKPSDEQIKAIRLARSFVADDFEEHPTLSEILMDLEKQLKKLKK